MAIFNSYVKLPEGSYLGGPHPVSIYDCLWFGSKAPIQGDVGGSEEASGIQEGIGLEGVPRSAKDIYGWYIYLEETIIITL